MSFEKLNVHSKIVGKGKKYLKNINDYIVKKSTISKKMFKYQKYNWRNDNKKIKKYKQIKIRYIINE